MKNKKLKLLGSASAAAVALSLSPLVGAQTQSSSAGTYNQPAAQSTEQAVAPSSPLSNSSAQLSGDASASSSLRIASKDESKHTAGKLAGKKIRGQDGAELGTVKDFLVDPHSGQVRFAVVSTGGFMGVGDKLHLVPFRQLQQDEKGFTASLTKEQLDQAPAVNEEQFEENKVSANTEDQQNASSSTMEANAAASGQLVRATKIKSHDVKANGTKIGSIEGIVIEPGTGDAVALLDPSKDVADTKQKFLVPLNRFTFSGKKDNDITTTLTRADFQAAGQYNATASASTSNGAPQTEGVATTTNGGTAASGELAQSKSTSVANEQTQTASNSTQTTSPLSDQDSANRSSMAANQSSSASAQNTASSDQFGASSAQTGQSSGFAQNTPSSSATSSTTSLSSTGENEPSNVAQTSTPSTSATTSADMNSSSATGSQNEQSSVAQASTASGSSTSSADVNSFAAPGSQDQQSNVASNDSTSTTSTASVENGTTTPGLTPTGQTSADQNPQADPTLISAAQAIRHALDSDPEVGHADVTVTPENGKVVLKGQVSSDSLKSQIEKKAQTAANGAQIDSQLKVQNQ